MEIRHLHYFIAVARTCHFGRAAEHLHMAQSPLSQAIRQLETSLGATLFTRTTRHVELTPAGKALLHDAERILASIEVAETRVRLLAVGSTGLLRVGSTGLAALRHVPRLARIAARDVPGLVLRFQPDLLTAAQESALQENRIDLAVLRPPLRSTGLSCRLVTRERMLLAVPRDHRLAGAGQVALAELRDEDFVVYGVPDSVVDTVVTQACLAAGFLPRRAHSATETTTILTLVASGLGVALLPESASALTPEGVRFVPLVEHVHLDLALAWRAGDPSPALARLLEALEADGFLAPDVDLAPPSAPGLVPVAGSR